VRFATTVLTLLESPMTIAQITSQIDLKAEAFAMWPSCLYRFVASMITVERSKVR